jgi:cytochrome c
MVGAGLRRLTIHSMSRSRFNSVSLFLPSMALLAASLATAPAAANQQLAADLGCYNCHGNPPKKKAPVFAELAARYAGTRDDPGARAKLADKLRDGSIFSHIDAHERLSPEVAGQLILWISEGAR